MYASVDLGGTKIAAAVGTAEGSIRAQAAAPTRSHEGPEAVIERTAALVNGLAREVGQRPVALGLGVPGLTDIEAGTTRFLPNLTGGWRDVSVRSLLAAAIGCPVSVLNDSRMATLGELTYGRGRTARTFIYLSLGTGIGGGVVVEGRLQLGPLGAAGELGHQTILPDGPHCTCGNRGCLETLASGPALTARGIFLLQCGRAPILRDLVKGDLSRVTPREMADAAAHGEATVRAEIVRVAAAASPTSARCSSTRCARPSATGSACFRPIRCASSGRRSTVAPASSAASRWRARWPRTGSGSDTRIDD
jgi:glucokinase